MSRKRSTTGFVERAPAQLKTWVIIGLVLVMAHPCHGQDVARSKLHQSHEMQKANQVVCGPRCIQFLLRHYNVLNDKDLVSIIREVQWPNLEAGVSLHRINEFLQQRKIHTKMLQVDRSSHLVLREPAVVHLHTDLLTGPGSLELDHFAVLLPGSSSHSIRLWDGLNGIVEMPREAFHSNWSGAILLTAGSPINAVDIDSIVTKAFPIDLLLSASGLSLFVVLLREGYRLRCLRADS